MTRVRRLLLLALAALMLLPVVSGIAAAHTVLVSSEPAAGSRAGASPPRVRLVFSEALEPALARVSLIDANGHALSLVVAGDPHDVHSVFAPLDSLAAGAYRVRWRVVSADGHPVDGSFVFAVAGTTGVAEQPAMPEPPALRPMDDGPPDAGRGMRDVPVSAALLRGFALTSAMALAGVLLFVTWPRAGDGVTPVSARPLATSLVMGLAVSTPLLIGAHAAAWLVNASAEHRLTAEALSDASRATAGQVELWRIALALLALWALALARRPRLALFFASGALVVSGASGHPAAIMPAWTIPAKAVHLLAGSAWLGGLLWLFLVARAQRAIGDTRSFAREASRVSAVALGALVLVALSGALQTALFLESPSDLVRSAYGAMVLAKTAGLVALIGFGAYHRYRVLPGLAPSTPHVPSEPPATSATSATLFDPSVAARLAATVRSELAVMCAVILLGGLLSYLSPPAHPPSALDALATFTDITIP